MRVNDKQRNYLVNNQYSDIGLMSSLFYFHDTINNRLKYWFNKNFFSNNVPNDDTVSDHAVWFLLLYIDSTSEKFSSICKDINIKLTFFSDNKLNRFIKGALPKFDNKNVIYKICCKNCDVSYVRQTCRKFSSRSES